MRLKEYRVINGMTQIDVAKAIGIPTKTYQNYEREVREANSVILCSLADLYGITLDELVGRGAVSADEEALVNSYRSMNDDGRSALLMAARALADKYRSDAH